MSRDPQARSARVLRFGVASMGALVGSVAKKLKDSKVMKWSTRCCMPLGVDLRLVRSVLNACFNVDARAPPANGGRIYVAATCPVGLKLIGERARMW